MSRRRSRGLAVLMRARMRAAASRGTTAALQPLGVARDLPPPTPHPDPHAGGDLSSGIARRFDGVDRAKDLIRASIRGNSRSLVADVNERAVRDFIQVLSGMDQEGRWELLQVLADEYYVDRGRVRSLMRQYLALDITCSSGGLSDGPHADSPEYGPVSSVCYRMERNLMESLRPEYATLIEQINAKPGGLKLLVDLRADLLSLLREHNSGSLRSLDFLLKEKLVTCLSPATLELRKITWSDSAVLLEKIVAYEAVHPIRNLLDLKRRLSTGRRCFGYLHPAIPGEPLIFIEVALLKNIAHSIQEVLWECPPIPEFEAACALLYSISSTQLGLSGINLGRFLIKRVIELLKKEMPHISIFATLSPVPGYMQWLQSKLACHSKFSEHSCGDQVEDGSSSILMENILTIDEERELIDLCMGHISGRNGMEVMRNILASPTNEWMKNDKVLKALRPPLLRLCSRYLLNEKKRGKALDTVANFHLQNGAVVERINWMADRSHKGLQQSGGIMVNYVYRLDEIEENVHAYTSNGNIRVSRNALY